MHDKERGALSLIRVVNGSLKKGDRVTISSGGTEVVQRIYEPLADEYREISQIESGNVGVCAGIKVKFNKYLKQKIPTLKLKFKKKSRKHQLVTYWCQI